MFSEYQIQNVVFMNSRKLNTTLFRASSKLCFGFAMRGFLNNIDVNNLSNQICTTQNRSPTSLKIACHCSCLFRCSNKYDENCLLLWWMRSGLILLQYINPKPLNTLWRLVWLWPRSWLIRLWFMCAIALEILWSCRYKATKEMSVQTPLLTGRTTCIH